MARRAFWKGYLKLSLVTCRVVMSPAVSESGNLRFRNVNRNTGHLVENAYADSQTGEPVDDEDVARGYEYDDGRFVLLDDEELDEVALESTRTIDIDRFVDAAAVDPAFFDAPHYLKPADKVGAEAFAVIREAMNATGTAGLSRLVLYRREHPLLILPRDSGMMAWTLRQAEELRDRPPAPDADKPAAKPLTMMKRLIGERLTDWSPKLADDPVGAHMRAIVKRRAAKGKGRPKPADNPADEAKPRDNVINIMDALKKSLAKEKKG